MLLLQTFDCTCLCYFQIRIVTSLYYAGYLTEFSTFRHQAQQYDPSGLFRQALSLSYLWFPLKKAVPQEEAKAKEITEAHWIWLKAAWETLKPSSSAALLTALFCTLLAHTVATCSAHSLLNMPKQTQSSRIHLSLAVQLIWLSPCPQHYRNASKGFCKD